MMEKMAVQVPTEPETRIADEFFEEIYGDGKVKLPPKQTRIDVYIKRTSKKPKKEEDLFDFEKTFMEVTKFADLNIKFDEEDDDKKGRRGGFGSTGV